MPDETVAVILAGGLARRMGNVDKALIALGGKPLIDHVASRFERQCDHVIINANGDATRFSHLGLPVIADTIGDFPGPLAGVLAAMEWTQKNQPKARWIVSIPSDTPFAPPDMTSRFLATIAETGARLTCARSNDRCHPVAALWPVDLAGDLHTALAHDNIRKVDLWTSRYNLVPTDFDTTAHDPFFNINRPHDLETAAKILHNNTHAPHPV